MVGGQVNPVISVIIDDEYWCWFFYIPQEQISKSAVRRDLIRED